jgi:nucleotide-binding universal stress UspA family protein
MRDGDVRSSLSRLLDAEHVDLLVMSAHGRGSRPDVACGSVADYMISHAHIPLLLVTGAHAHGGDHITNNHGTDRPARGRVS